MADETSGDETFWRWSILIAGAVIVAAVSAMLFVGKGSTANSSATATTSPLQSGLPFVTGTTPTTDPANTPSSPTTTPTGTLPSPFPFLIAQANKAKGNGKGKVRDTIGRHRPALLPDAAVHLRTGRRRHRRRPHRAIR